MSTRTSEGAHAQVGIAGGRAPRRRRRSASCAARMRAGILGLLALGAGACGGRVTPPSADDPVRPAPDLGGWTVIVVPLQVASLRGSAGVPVMGEAAAALEAELVRELAERAPRVRWVTPADLDRVIARSPGVAPDPRRLDVSGFQRARVERIGDPLYGDLRRLATLVDARIALLPVAAAHVTPPGAPARVELAAALVDTFGGEVVWFGIVAGSTAPEPDAEAAGSAGRALARALAP